MRSARTTMLYAAVLAVPMLAVGLFSDGPHAARILGGAVVLLVGCGIASAWMAWRGPKIDEEQDEREDYIVGNASRFSFAVMAVAVETDWALQFAARGNEGDTSFWLLVVLWGSFAAGYGYNKVRH